MPHYPEKLRRLMDGLRLVEDRSDRIQLLIDTADRFREVPGSVARRPFDESRRVPHCESEAFVWAEERPDGALKFYFAVDNPQGISARAMAVILDETLSGADPAEIAAVPGDLPLEIFGRELSMGKSMGLMGMLGMVQLEARRRLAARSPDAPGTAP